MINVIFKCDECGYLTEGSGNDEKKAKEHTFQNYHFNNGKNCNGTFKFHTIVNLISDKYNEVKMDKIRKSTCQGCKLKPCLETPEMLAFCQFEAYEYRLRSGKYNISSGAGISKFSEDIKGVIIDNTPVYVEDIKRLFIARWDTFSLYPKDYTGNGSVPETYQPPTDDDILRCLMGETTIGFKPVNPETGIYKWICYDVDKHSCKNTIYESNPRNAVDEIVKRLKEWYGLTGYIELSGSPDSYHIWVFIEPVDKELVYIFDDSFKARCDPLINQAICCRVQHETGRMIRMVYSINLKNKNRSKFIDGIDISKIQPEKLPIIE